MFKIEQTLTSMEVAEMIGREHKELLRSIRLYAKNMDKVAERNSALGKENAEGENIHGSKEEYFRESSYEDANGQNRPCFNVTKKGCEFIAHKMHGIKGTEFTMRYIDRFHEMEEEMNEPKSPKTTMELLELHYKALKEVDARVNNVSTEVGNVRKELESFKNDMPILGIEENKITTAVKKLGVKILGGKESNAYKDRSLRSKLYSDIHRELKRQFGVTTYKAIKRSQCDTALSVIKSYKPPLTLATQIGNRNAQMNMEVD